MHYYYNNNNNNTFVERHSAVAESLIQSHIWPHICIYMHIYIQSHIWPHGQRGGLKTVGTINGCKRVKRDRHSAAMGRYFVPQNVFLVVK